MPRYRYTARDERGTAVTGTLAAPSREALADQLKRTGYLVTRAREVAGEAALEGMLQRCRGVRADDLVLFNIQLAKLVEVGIPLVTALETLRQQTANPILRQAVGEVARNVEAGSSFSESLALHPAIFSELFINMVRAGEVSGKLDEILQRLATFGKRQAELREQVKTALTYPLLLVTASGGAIAFLVMGIIPKFMAIFLEANVPLPLPTRLLYDASQFLWQQWAVLLIAGGLGGAMGQAWMRTPAGRRWIDARLLRVPVFGDFVRQAAMSRMARSLQTLLASGVPVLEAMAITGKTCGNAVIADVCRTAQTSVKQGGALSDTFRVSREFPPMVVQMVTVGEASGTLDTMLGEIADHYDERLRHELKRLTAFIEPMFLLVMGGVVAFIMASVLLPLFRMVQVIR